MSLPEQSAPLPRGRNSMTAGRAVGAGLDSDRFGKFGGRFVPETLIAALDELVEVYREASNDPAYWAELEALWRDYVGRPTPLYRADRLGEAAGGIEVYLKRED